MNFSQEQIDHALNIVAASIANCERAQLKFAEGSSQYSLLRNRIAALKISEDLLRNDGTFLRSSKEELEQALPPIRSIRSKTANARKKHEEGSTWYKRLTKTIDAMDVCEALIAAALA